MTEILLWPCTYAKFEHFRSRERSNSFYTIQNHLKSKHVRDRN